MPAPPRTSERLLIAALPEIAANRVLCTSLGRGQLAAHLAASSPGSTVVCNFLDLFLATQAQEATPNLPGLRIACEADFPDIECDLAAIPVSMAGDAELTRDLLQQAHQRLAIGGRLAAATDNPRDTWLHDELRNLFAKVTRMPQTDGVVYSASKAAPLKKVKDFACQFAFRDRGRLLHALSRPGVFSHRHIDGGTRALMETMEIEPGQRVFDIGSGWGAVSLAAAASSDRIHVYASDSNPRAIECTRRSAELNQLANITVALGCNAECDAPGSYDVALANPPYYSHFKIAEVFLSGAQRALRRGGVLYVVTKQPDWYLEAMRERFGEVTLSERRGYAVVRAVHL